MKLALDSFWRAAMYCLHPRVVALSILPLAIMVVLALGLGYFFWTDLITWVRLNLESYGLVQTMLGWLEGIGLGSLRTVLAPLLVLFLALPIIVITSLLFVAVLMTPAMVSLVAERRFAQLEKKRGASWSMALLWSLGATLVALLVLVLSIPLWFIPPLILVLPPLIWGWLTYRVMAFDALSEHASAAERQQIFKEHRGNLLGIGIISGYLGAAPSVVWASGALFVAMAPILVPIAIWVYTLVFAFSSLWFAHYCLAALEQMRKAQAIKDQTPQPAPQPVPALPASSNPTNAPAMPLPFDGPL
jgi:hypothetical protein